MNDRFKFRIWWKKENRYRVDTHIIPIGHLTDFANSDEYVVEQCTGLKDKNGNLIYEGDVVYDSVYENNFVVSWDNDRTGYILSANNTNHIDYLSKILIERHNLKIIGNIHEQAEQKDNK